MSVTFSSLQVPGTFPINQDVGKWWNVAWWAFPTGFLDTLSWIPSGPIGLLCVYMVYQVTDPFPLDYGSFVLLPLPSSSGGWVPGKQLVLLLKIEAGKALGSLFLIFVTMFPPHIQWRVVILLSPPCVISVSIETFLLSTTPTARLSSPWALALLIVSLHDFTKPLQSSWVACHFFQMP